MAESPLLMHVVGARPNFVKLAPVHRALAARGLRQVVLHTGQHYDDRMSGSFFRELGIPEADINLGVGSGSHAAQTARVMAGFDEVLDRLPPRAVLVYGDVNSTLAAALVGAKRGFFIAHVEAGLRSGDRTMPEELNRLVTDQLSDLLFTPSEDADRNLLREGIDPARIRCVGNVMVDTLLRFLPAARRAAEGKWPASYAVLTVHRPSNVDDPAGLARLLGVATSVAARIPVVFPVHPRTRRALEPMLAGGVPEGLRIIEPLGYLDFLGLQAGARFVVTDSGGIQEETTVLGVPCITVRANTERPVTVERGTNVLVGQDADRLLREVESILRGDARKGGVPPLWDGRAGERIAEALERELGA